MRLGSTTTTDERWMLRAAALARRSWGQTLPNPMVGALVVKDHHEISRGFHARAGDPHAEAMALARAGERARGADLYVTLEPCAHEGRTPPCVDAIIEAGIARVIAGVRDPNPLVDGKGFARLIEAGITVIEGVMEPLCRTLIAPYETWLTTGRPYVHLKLAMSMDGRIAPASGSSRWITGIAARRYSHRLRRCVEAVLVGIGTACADDPQLDVRLSRPPRMHPIPIVLDTNARLPHGSRIVSLRSADTVPIVVCGRSAPPERRGGLEAVGVRVVIAEEQQPGYLSIPAVLAALANEGVHSVLVEGGSQIASAFIASKAVDRATILMAPVFLGSRGVPSVGDLGMITLQAAPRATLSAVRRIGPDIAVELQLRGA